jgi:hypothetical protein
LLFNSSIASAEDADFIRQALREKWPVANGEPILEALTSAILLAVVFNLTACGTIISSHSRLNGGNSDD